jgi:hypothetical protein
MEGHDLLIYPRLVAGIQYNSARLAFDAGTRLYTYGDLRKRAFDAFRWHGRLEQYSMHVYMAPGLDTSVAERRCNSWDSFDAPDTVYFTYGSTTLPVHILYHTKPSACKCAIL